MLPSELVKAKVVLLAWALVLVGFDSVTNEDPEANGCMMH